MAPELLPVRVLHIWAARHQPLVSGARPQLFQLSFARERAATEQQQQQGLSPFGSPHSPSCWAPFVLRTKMESEDPEAFSVYSKSLAEKVTFEILPM